jgi:hypothetical protein
MINSHLANIRWLSTESQNLGQDWFERSLELDMALEDLGLDLAEESVFLIYSEGPSEVLEGKGRCRIGRSVIGPKREVSRPFSLIDWKAAPVWRENVQGETLEEILEQAQDQHFKAHRGAKALAPEFILCVKRQLAPELKLRVEAIFHE